jgi:hypothetical protein
MFSKIEFIVNEIIILVLGFKLEVTHDKSLMLDAILRILIYFRLKY